MCVAQCLCASSVHACRSVSSCCKCQLVRLNHDCFLLNSSVCDCMKQLGICLWAAPCYPFSAPLLSWLLLDRPVPTHACSESTGHFHQPLSVYGLLDSMIIVVCAEAHLFFNSLAGLSGACLVLAFIAITVLLIKGRHILAVMSFCCVL